MPAHGSRFVMNFNNKPQYSNAIYNSIAPNLAAAPRAKNGASNGDFQTPMISRVHKARAGCSACGKKMA